MFNSCNNLKKIDVSKFNSSKCETIHRIFCGCHSITEIDMINWDMSNLKTNTEDSPIYRLFDCCRSLKLIKISGNLNKNEANKKGIEKILYDVPKKGILIFNKNVDNNIDFNKCLPSNWARSFE